MPSNDQTKIEKKFFDEKIEKVRQVVPHLKVNDVILALHTFDMDVDRTIQAFCEEGTKGALGDWENTSKPKKTKKNKNGVAPTNTTTTPAVKTQKQNGYSANGYAGNATTATSSSSSLTKPKTVPQKPNLPNLEKIQRLSAPEINKEIERQSSELSKAEKMFEVELLNAQKKISQCFEEICRAARERESQLLAALNQAKEDGQRYLKTRKSTLQNLQQNKTPNNLPAELKKFLNLKSQDNEFAQITRFVYDNSQVIRSVAKLGEVIPVGSSINGTNQIPIKSATSHSSIASSVGEDSGLGQISPVSNGKAVATVEKGGIAMQSEGLSTDELAEIQRQLAERLKAQGIDPNVLASSELAPVVSRRPQKDNKKAANADQQKGKNKPSAQIKLSILS
uniref:CUE domain-containing protein n=1 Tax=Panagrolaimus sp. JU765 TaxID=591449 RepID=A0AC34QAN4_9BILA